MQVSAYIGAKIQALLRIKRELQGDRKLVWVLIFHPKDNSSFKNVSVVLSLFTMSYCYL